MTTTILLTLVVIGLRLWVPVSVEAFSPYGQADLFEQWTPRALAGTLAHHLPLFGSWEDRGLLAVNALALVLWLTCALRLVAGTSGVGLGFAQKTFWLLILAFSPVGYSAALSFFIDPLPAALVAMVALLCTASLRETSHRAIAALWSAVLVVLATLSHEMSFFGFAVLAVWLLWARGAKHVLVMLVPGLLTSILALAVAAGPAPSGLKPTGYLSILLAGPAFFWREAFNAWGILMGAGMLWVVYAVVALRFCASGDSRRSRALRCLVAAGMPLICLSALAVAHDTNRMASLLWLPTVLLAGHWNTRTARASAPPPPARTAASWTAVTLVVLQLAIPPGLVYQQGFVPYNCYAVWVSTRVMAEPSLGHGAPQWRLFVHQDNPLTQFFQKTCAPLEPPAATRHTDVP